MKRENRYYVLKRTDLEVCLTEDEINTLNVLGRKVANHRHNRKAPEFECVVIESDWPEYEPVWDMIEKRMATK